MPRFQIIETKPVRKQQCGISPESVQLNPEQRMFNFRYDLYMISMRLFNALSSARPINPC